MSQDNSNINSHLFGIELTNFKRFSHIEINGFKKSNLFVGDNNVGKTSILEALLFDFDRERYVKRLDKLLVQRGLGDIYVKTPELYSSIPTDSFFTIKLKKSESQFCRMYWRDRLNVSYDLFPPTIEIGINGTFNQNDAIEYELKQDLPFLSYNWNYTADISTDFSKYFNKNIPEKNRLIESLRVFIPGTKYITFDLTAAKHNMITFEIEGQQSTSLLALFGSGTIKLFLYLVEIIKNTNGRLMIDEIDNGIHYSKLKEFWKTILHAAHNNNVQLFMTTHSKECLQYYKEALNELGQEYQENARVFSLNELPDKSVKAFTYDYERFSNSLDLDNEIRGGN